MTIPRTLLSRSPVLPLALLAILVLAACGAAAVPAGDAGGTEEVTEVPEGMEVATFAGGCFWCMEPPFDKIDGVQSTTSGYTGGEEPNPTYKEVSSGRTGHAEAVRIVYDPETVTYSELLSVFWHNIDPTVEDRQFCDWGSQYRTAIYFHDEEQKRLAEETREQVKEELGQTVYTEIEPAGPFYAAEDYHQNFYEKSPVRYKSYRTGCGRDARLEELWGEAAGGK